MKWLSRSLVRGFCFVSCNFLNLILSFDGGLFLIKDDTFILVQTDNDYKVYFTWKHTHT